MLDDILKNLSDSYTADLLSAEEELDMVSTRLREERKFLKMLIKDEGESFNEFSPRSNTEDTGKIAETRAQIDELEKRQSEINISIDVSRKKLSDLKTAREELSHILKGNTVGKKELEKRQTADEETYHELLYKLKNISSYLPADPLRAKIELQTLLKEAAPEEAEASSMGDHPTSDSFTNSSAVDPVSVENSEAEKDLAQAEDHLPADNPASDKKLPQADDSLSADDPEFEKLPAEDSSSAQNADS